MSILAIARNFDGNPNIVTIVTDDDLTALTTTGYWDLPETKDSVALLQNGEWEWADTDLVLIHYDTTLIGFFVYIEYQRHKESMEALRKQVERDDMYRVAAKAFAQGNKRKACALLKEAMSFRRPVTQL